MQKRITGIAGRASHGKDTLASLIASNDKGHKCKIISFGDPVKKLCADLFDIDLDLMYDTQAKESEIVVRVDKTKLTSFANEIYGFLVRKTNVKKKLSFYQVPERDDGDRLQKMAFQMAKRLKSLIKQHSRVYSPFRRKWRWITIRSIMQIVGTDIMRKMAYDTVWVDAYINSVERASADHILTPDVRFPNEAKIVKELGGTMFKIDRPGQRIDSSGHDSEALVDKIEYDQGVVNDGGVDDLNDKVKELFRQGVL